jgi:macrolide-specific efflux system membrane fusion protein
MRGKWLLIAGSTVFVAIAAIALVVWSRERKPPPEPAPAIAQPAAPSGEISISGRIHARRITSVNPGVAGQIEEFHADVGDEVFEGQLLARLSNQGLDTARETAQAAVDSAQERVIKIESAINSARLEASRARADAARARSEFDRADKALRRQRTLHAEGATPRLAYEKAEGEFQTAKIETESLAQLASQADERIQQLLRDLEAAKRTLADRQEQLEDIKTDLQAAEVRSPVNGIVVSREGVVGEQTEIGTEAHLFGIATDLSQLSVEIEPEPPVLARLQIGYPTLVFVADVPQALDGTVREIDGSRVMVDFTSPNPLVRPSLTAQVRLKFEP